MRAGVGIDPDLDYLLDPQQRRPVGLCVCCGKEIYDGNAYDDICYDCFEEANYRDV